MKLGPTISFCRDALGVAGTLALLASAGCYRIPEGQSAIDTVDLRGTHAIDDDELAERIITRESPRFLGLFSGVVYEYELFDRYALRRDLLRIERYLKAHGYYDAKVRASRVVPVGKKVQVTIEIIQGDPIVVGEVVLEGAAALDATSQAKVQASVASILPKGAPLDEEKFAETEKAVLGAMTARGHAAAKVKRVAEVDLATHTARLRYAVEPGPIATVGDVTFEGLGEIPEDKVRRLFIVEKGQRYSSAELDDAKQALLDLGVFASINVEQDLSGMGTTNVVPLKVTTEVSKLRAILAGFGFEFDSLRTDVHGTIGWQSSNFLGGLRRFEVTFKPGLVLWPTRLPDIEAPEKVLFEQRLSASLRQPAFIERRTTGLARADYSVYPVLLPNNSTTREVQRTVVGYHEVRGTVGVERSFFGAKLFVTPQYGLQANFPFNYVGVTQNVPALLVSYLDVRASLDFRDDPIHTRKGIYLGTQLQVAGGVLQGDASDVRIQPEIRGYVPLSKRVVFAARTSVGFLFPRNYGDQATLSFDGQTPTSNEDLNRDYQIYYFRGFFAGGPASNRGYPLRGIGPYALIPYLSPVGQSTGAGGCDPTQNNCLLPTGGLSIWEASAELRLAVAGPFSTAVFCDAADVSPYLTNLRFDRPHLSCGAGARYDTPVGPIRVDIGYRIPGVQVASSRNNEVEPDELLGLPIAVAFGIGESF